MNYSSSHRTQPREELNIPRKATSICIYLFTPLPVITSTFATFPTPSDVLDKPNRGKLQGVRNRTPALAVHISLTVCELGLWTCPGQFDLSADLRPVRCLIGPFHPDQPAPPVLKPNHFLSPAYTTAVIPLGRPAGRAPETQPAARSRRGFQSLHNPTQGCVALFVRPLPLPLHLDPSRVVGQRSRFDHTGTGNTRPHSTQNFRGGGHRQGRHNSVKRQVHV